MWKVFTENSETYPHLNTTKAAIFDRFFIQHILLKAKINSALEILTFLSHEMLPIRWHWFCSHTMSIFRVCQALQMLDYESVICDCGSGSGSINGVNF